MLRAVNLDLGEASIGHNQPNLRDDDDDDREWILSIVSAGKPKTPEATVRGSKARIHKVPASPLKDENNYSKYYKPRVVSIGPYHYHEPELRKADMKLKMAKDFAQYIAHGVPSDATVEATIRGWYRALSSRMEEWRECYQESTTNEYSKRTMARMMLLDGCFILQYSLEISSYQDYFRYLKMNSQEVAFVQLDLFMLENQLPYGVLKTLMGNREQEMKKRIRDLVASVLIGSPPSQDLKKSDHSHLSDPSHLLEFLRELLLGSSPKHYANKYCAPWRGRRNKSTWHSFRNIKELTAGGIELIPSDTCGLRNVTYTSSCMKGYLKLPRIIVDDSMAAKFLNLIAYEMCPGAPDDLGVSSYVCFLDSLIDHEDDVKELRDARILYNFFGSDREVAELFKKMGADLVPNSEAYGEVRSRIQGYYSSKAITRARSWVVQFKRDYFSTPWAFVAFMGAILALLLTAIQTFYTVFPP